MAHTGVSEIWKPVSIEEVRQAKEQAIMDQDFDKATRLRDIERKMMISKREEEEARLDQPVPGIDHLGDLTEEEGAAMRAVDDICGDPLCPCAPPEVREAAEEEEPPCGDTECDYCYGTEEDRSRILVEQEELEDELLIEEIEALLEDQQAEFDEHLLDELLEEQGEVWTPIRGFALSSTGELVVRTQINSERTAVSRIPASELPPFVSKYLLYLYGVLAPTFEELANKDILKTLNNAEKLAGAVLQGIQEDRADG